MKLKNLIEQERDGYSLARDFYTDPDIFEKDMERVFRRQWLLSGHTARIPKAGDYYLYEIGRDSVIVARGRDGEVSAFHNVCRHRGSRVCLKGEGNTRLFVCPYHAWTYDLDGSLRGAPYMPDDFDKRTSGLKACAVRVVEGLIFLCLSDNPPDFDLIAESARPFLKLHGAADAKLAVRRSYPTDANWKLVVDNFQECYHCAPSHKLYSTAHSRDKLLASGAGPGSGPADAMERYSHEYSAFQEKARAAGTWLDPVVQSDSPNRIWSMGRHPIRTGAVTESADGAPVSRLMGQFKEYDGGQSGSVFNLFSYFLANNDHFVLIRFTPRDAINTDVEFMWFVAPDAQEGIDYEVEKLTQVWDVTTMEDKTITEDNQAGVLDGAYEPGPFSLLEGRLAMIKRWYLEHLEEGEPAAQADLVPAE